MRWTFHLVEMTRHLFMMTLKYHLHSSFAREMIPQKRVDDEPIALDDASVVRCLFHEGFCKAKSDGWPHIVVTLNLSHQKAFLRRHQLWCDITSFSRLFVFPSVSRWSQESCQMLVYCEKRYAPFHLLRPPQRRPPLILIQPEIKPLTHEIMLSSFSHPESSRRKRSSLVYFSKGVAVRINVSRDLIMALSPQTASSTLP